MKSGLAGISHVSPILSPIMATLQPAFVESLGPLLSRVDSRTLLAQNLFTLLLKQRRKGALFERRVGREGLGPLGSQRSVFFEGLLGSLVAHSPRGLGGSLGDLS